MGNFVNLTFRKGLRDGLPIAVGYLSVSFAFGILAVNSGLPVWAPIVTSLTNFTGTGQFVGTTLIAAGAAIAEIAFTLFVINARYILMSISLSQRLEKMNIWKKMFIAFGNTDEIFAVAISKYTDLNFKYMAGLILCSFGGWIGGTTLGALCGSVIPDSILSAMGIALYAMFIAIIIPPAKKSRAVLLVVAAGAIISVAIYYIPVINTIGDSWRIIIAGVLATLIGTITMPLKDEPKEPPEFVEAIAIESNGSKSEASENNYCAEGEIQNDFDISETTNKNENIRLSSSIYRQPKQKKYDNCDFSDTAILTAASDGFDLSATDEARDEKDLSDTPTANEIPDSGSVSRIDKDKPIQGNDSNGGTRL